MTRPTYPPGTLQYLRDRGAFRPVRWCARCGCMVSKWHEHWTKPGEALDATGGHLMTRRAKIDPKP